jgi:peptide/nickel transport system substrate-binding protein
MLNVWYVAWNQDPAGPFADAGTRQAMMLALDRQAFIDAVLRGLARPGATTFHPDSHWADPALSPRPYDPEQAAALLAGAGWEDHDGDGVLDRDGRPFRFTLLFARGSQEIVPRMAAWMQQSWAGLGIGMEIENLEWQAFLERRNSGNFQAVMATLSFSPEPDQFELYHSSAREGGFNFYGLNDPEVDRLLEEGREQFDTGERLAVYRRLQRRLFELEPLGCVFHFASPVLHQPDITGIEPSPRDLWRHWPGPRAWKRGGDRR